MAAPRRLVSTTAIERQPAYCHLNLSIASQSITCARLPVQSSESLQCANMHQSNRWLPCINCQPACCYCHRSAPSALRRADGRALTCRRSPPWQPAGALPPPPARLPCWQCWPAAPPASPADPAAPPRCLRECGVAPAERRDTPCTPGHAGAGGMPGRAAAEAGSIAVNMLGWYRRSVGR